MVWGVLGGGALFWGMWTVLHVFTFLVLSLRIYYVGQFRLGMYIHSLICILHKYKSHTHWILSK